MRIHNIRLGHATNSSSSHSIILNPSSPEFLSDNQDGFGWENFCLKSKENKTKYFACQLFCNLHDIFSPEYAARITNEFFDKKIIDYKKDDFTYNYYVDHQSCFTLPLKFDKKEINLEFFQEFSDYVINNNSLAITGGNDNDENHYDYGGTREFSQLPKDENHDIIAKKDGNYWILFNRHSGAKLRISFQETKPYIKSTYPELVDLKITNYCNYGCEFCYQNSTTQGKHGDYKNLCNIISTLANMEVFGI